MSKKEVSFAVRPKSRKAELPSTSEEWVAKGKTEREAMTKLSLKIPNSLHRSFKTRCVQEGVTIQDKVRTMIEVCVSETPSKD